MATIGLYDIDFNHGQNFSISLPLMKAYRKLSDEGHIVIMMKPYEKTGRYNKIFYFKEGKNPIPKGLTINTEKGKMVGYGFYGKTNLLAETIATPPDFTPYEMNYERIKNKTLFKSIRQNSLISWRDKDFSGVRTGAGITYVTDRDFMDNYDWEELFDHFDNNIKFIYTLYPNQDQIKSLMHKNYAGAKIVVPISFDEELVRELLDTKNIFFNNLTVSPKELLAFITFVKTFSNERIPFHFPCPNDELGMTIIHWGQNREQNSYVAFRKKYSGYLPIDSFHFNFKPKELLYQNPQDITPQQFKDKYLKYLT